MDFSKIIPFDNKIIGLSISGGADSAVLAYYLMKNIKEPLHFFTYASEEKQNRTVRNSIAVIEKCMSLTGKINIHHHIKYDKTQERDQFLNYLVESVNKKIVDVMYTATTSSPPESVLETFHEQLSPDLKQRRDPTQKKPLFSHFGKLYHPFINIDKNIIAEMYKELNLLDSLFPLTSSCESLSLSTGHCGQCWWCQERFWAFNKL
jgi:7-cyano-7-deazaguanine synthase in queuosine biosynthesis